MITSSERGTRAQATGLSRRYLAWLIIVGLVSAGCAGHRPTVDRSGVAAGATIASQTSGSDIKAKDFHPSLFDDDSATIDNPRWPLSVGTRFVWKGRAIEDDRLVERRVVFIVTDLTKVIAGVRTRVGWDRDYNNGRLGESELIFLAQDREGNVWHLGQYREVYEDEFVGGRIWVVGDPEGATAGILMKADPQLGDRSYSQGYAPPPWDWDDRAVVHAVGERVCVPIGCFDDVLVIDEFEPSVPGAHQLKYYAEGVGNIRVGWYGPNEDEREVMVLGKHHRLTDDGLALIREKALELEHRGYAYARTTPAEVG